MPVASASGYPVYSDSGQSKYIPQVWSAKLLYKYYEVSRLAAISNTDYEGEIKKQGDEIIIRTIPDVTIEDHTKGGTVNWEYLESPAISMLIDKAKRFSALSDDIDIFQADIGLIDMFQDDATEQMQITIETGILADVYADADDSNAGTTAGAISGDIDMGATTDPLVLSSANVLEAIVDANLCLDEYNVPERNRWGLIPAWLNSMIKLSDLKDASLAGDGTSILRNGRIGMIDRMTLYYSNLIYYVTDSGYRCFHVLFGQRDALSFASQITKFEQVRPSDAFAVGIKGLKVYGYKVLKEQALVDCYCRKSTA